MRRVLRAGLALLTLAGCGPAAAGSASPRPGDAGTEASSAGADGSSADASAVTDPDPVITTAAQAALQALSPEALPPAPPDVTNAFADSAAAAAFGQRLFYDASFSGPLLDPDNDGSSQSLGMVGQTGRVACAGCHLPASGFSDTRSFQEQISLGAGWGRRESTATSRWFVSAV